MTREEKELRKRLGNTAEVGGVMDYSTMEAGREMDALVAEKVMGLVPCQHPCHDIGNPRYQSGPCHARPDSPQLGGETAPYSTCISAAWEVVEKINGRYSLSIYHAVAVSSVMTGWTIGLAESVYPPGRKDEAVWGRAETLPLAICRAALKAVRARNPIQREEG